MRDFVDVIKYRMTSVKAYLGQKKSEKLYSKNRP